MKILFKTFGLLCLLFFGFNSYSQKIIEDYKPLKYDSVRIGPGEKDFLPYIQNGYTLMLPDTSKIKGVLIFLEDSKYDQKNFSAKQLYKEAADKGFAVLSVSSEIPLNFYFSKTSMSATHELIHEAFNTHDLPNTNIFFLGTSLVGHRAMRYIKFIEEDILDFKPNIKGIVICNFTLDFTRKWYQHQRDIRINKIDLGEPKFMNYMLETYLNGTPETNPEAYFNFSAYSYFDQKNRNIKYYSDLAVRAYVEPAIKYKLTNQLRTLYENNTTDLVGFLAELALAGNKNTELIVLQPEDNPSEVKNTQSTWNAIDKDELLNWIDNQTEEGH